MRRVRRRSPRWMALLLGVVMAAFGAVAVSVAVPAEAATSGAPLIVARRTATDLTWTSTLDYGKTAHGVYHYGKPDWTPVVWADGKIGAVETAGGKLLWHLSLDGASTHGIYTYGAAGDTPIVWGNGLIGFVHDNGTDLEWHLSLDRTTTHGIYKYGKHGDRPVVWGPGLLGFVHDTGTSLQWHLSIDRQTTHGIYTYGNHGDTPITWGPGLIGFTRMTSSGLQWHISTDRQTTHAIFTFGTTATIAALGLQVEPPDEPGDSSGVTLADLRAIYGTIPNESVVSAGLPGLNHEMAVAGITTPARKAAFLATLRNESGFRYDALQPGTSTYRGRGYIQLTGTANYTSAGNWLGVDLLGNPDAARSLPYSAKIARWYWTLARDINPIADRLDMGGVNKAIGYAPSAAEDTERCNDFKAALRYFNGSLPAGINCAR
jgi:predicted chitinase